MADIVKFKFECELKLGQCLDFTRSCNKERKFEEFCLKNMVDSS